MPVYEETVVEIALTNKEDFGVIGQFFLRLSPINFTSGSGRLEKADKDLKNKVTSPTKLAITVRNYLCFV